MYLMTMKSKVHKICSSPFLVEHNKICTMSFASPQYLSISSLMHFNKLWFAMVVNSPMFCNNAGCRLYKTLVLCSLNFTIKKNKKEATKQILF